MIKLLPFIVIPIIILSGLGYWRYLASKQALSTPLTNQQAQEELTEVPKTLPAVDIENRVGTVENTATKLVSSPSPQAVTSTVADSKLKSLEAAITNLNARLSALEKATPAPVYSSSKYPLYIPLGSGGGPWNDQAWLALNEYQISINPDNYTGYTSMQLEANFRLVEAAGTGSVRLYNVTDGSAIASDLNTTSSSFSTQTSATFKLPGGQKTYTIQVKSSQNMALFIQSARIKVNF